VKGRALTTSRDGTYDPRIPMSPFASALSLRSLASRPLVASLARLDP
jgi:hypothetical protein